MRLFAFTLLFAYCCGDPKGLKVDELVYEEVTLDVVNQYKTALDFERIKILTSSGDHPLANELIIECINSDQLPYLDEERRKLALKIGTDIYSSLHSDVKKNLNSIAVYFTKDKNRVF